MGDPRSKSKTPKTKESKAPHQQIQKNQTMKTTQMAVPNSNEEYRTRKIKIWGESF